MDKEIELLVNAIESLKQEPNCIKDYIFPIVSAFFTSILGGAIAYSIFKHQEYLQNEKNKMNLANKWILCLNHALHALLSIKGIYHGKLTNNPIQRSFAISDQIVQVDAIRENVYDLAFIAPKTNNKTFEYPKWSQIGNIGSLISNYNLVIKMWVYRNEVLQQIKEKVFRKHTNKAYGNLSQEEIYKLIGEQALSQLIHATESAVKLTDDVILELNDFLSNFPEYIKQKIDTKRLKKYGLIIRISREGNKGALDLLNKEPEVDYTSIESLFGYSAEELKKRYKTGYEQSE